MKKGCIKTNRKIFHKEHSLQRDYFFDDFLTSLKMTDIQRTKEGFMRRNLIMILISISIITSFNCISSQKKIEVDESFYKDCLETIKEKEKCDALVKKSEEREKEKEAKQIKLTEEQMAGLELRDNFKDRMMGKSKLGVIGSIGEPDERSQDGSGQEFFHYYKKPLTRYSAEHDPDKEIVIVFRREFVTRVLHTPPDSTPKSKIPFFGDKAKKK